MEAHFALSDAEFEKQFRACTLDAAIFTHEAHLRLAWIHIHQYGVDAAIEHITAQLREFVTRLGAAGKYNSTVTVAAIKAVNHFMQRSTTDNFYDFIREYPRLKYKFREIIRCHYSQDIFNSDSAKQTYLEPDLLAFT